MSSTPPQRKLNSHRVPQGASGSEPIFSPSPDPRFIEKQKEQKTEEPAATGVPAALEVLSTPSTLGAPSALSTPGTLGTPGTPGTPGTLGTPSVSTAPELSNSTASDANNANTDNDAANNDYIDDIFEDIFENDLEAGVVHSSLREAILTCSDDRSGERNGERSDDSDFTHPADMAVHLENLSLEKQVCVLRNMPTDEAAEALAELDQEVAGDVLENLDPDEAAQILSEMSPDDAADVLDELDKDHRDVLLSNLDHEDAEELRRLMSFDPETAGGIMNTEIILLEEDITSDEAILQIRREMEDKEIPYYAYVVDEDDKLIGVLSLRDLILSRPGTILRDALHNQDAIAVRYDVDRVEVARSMSHYNFVAMPVVDYENRLLGVVTYDDILDVMEDEASADLLGMVGAGQDENMDTPWRESVTLRLPWLMVNMVTSAMSAGVVYMYEGSIAAMAILAVLMPMVANQAGNTGQQALAVMIRQLATERFDKTRAWMAVLREGKIGLSTGFIMALLAFGAIWGLTGHRVLGMVMGGALMGDMLLGALAGGAIPLVFRALGRDPAQASSIFLTAITDGAGFFIFLGLATTFLL